MTHIPKEQSNIQEVMEEKAKELIGNWGYEEEYWWKPVKEALLEAYQQGRKEWVQSAIEAIDNVEITAVDKSDKEYVTMSETAQYLYDRAIKPRIKSSLTKLV